jgi:CelD/BcsL family acetyltransferase involved in cellulose biosynthesis
MASSLDAELITDLDGLQALAPAWDALAVACGRPLTTPAWMLGAWRHLPPPNAELRAVAVREGGELIALAPFYVERKGAARVDLRLLLGGMMPRIGPLALPGREWEAAAPIAAALAGAQPRADVLALESTPLASQWPAALADCWPGPLRPSTRRYFVQSAPFVSLAAGSLDGWFAGKSSHFRKRMKRLRRAFAEAGGTARASTQATVRDDVAAFMRLHAGRWEGKGESAIVARQAELTVLYEEIARAHLDSGRFRLYLLELDGEPIAAELFAAAGGELVSINGGFDERHAKLGPSHLTIMHAMEEAFAHGDTRLDLGPGDQHFKQRFGDGDDPVCWTLLIVPRPRMPLTLARVTPTLARVRTRDALKRALPPEQLDRVRGLRQRLRASS